MVDDFTLRGSVAWLRVGSNYVCVWVSKVSRQGESCGRGSFGLQYRSCPDAHKAVSGSKGGGGGVGIILIYTAG